VNDRIAPSHDGEATSLTKNASDNCTTAVISAAPHRGALVKRSVVTK
jgi:hypothetical protein